MSIYLEAYNEAVDWHAERDLRAWAERLSRHHRSLRRPYARGWLALPADEETDMLPSDDVRRSVP